MKNISYICIGALFAVLAFGSCNDAIDILIGKIRSGRYSPSFTVRQVPDARN